MTLPASGIIKLSDIQTEFGGANPIGLSEYYRGGAYVTSNNTSVPTSGAISLTNFYGATNVFSFTILSSTQDANLNTLAIAAGWDGSAPLICNISAGVYVWSDSTANAGLIVSVPCTINNSGYIIGKGGNANGYAGGAAISITSSGVTLTNNSGAYIAGGGGGGGSGGAVTGGGGAGGGASGSYNGGSIGGAGAGAGGAYFTYGEYGTGYRSAGGGAGGGGGARDDTGSDTTTQQGSAGGRVLPGTGGRGASCYAVGGYGGSAGNVGANFTSNGDGAGGGGGGWGANGGQGSSGGGGAGGAAISGTSPTLTNNGTIYGSTV